MIEERLLIALRGRANPKHVVTVRGEVLAGEIEASEIDLGTAVAKLERAGLLTILSPLPFLVLKLRSWSGEREKGADSRPSAYSYGSSNNRLNEGYRPDEADGLLREILDTLGENDPTTFEGAIRNFPETVIRKALDRVRRARSLRKNRTALFRYLLTKLS